MKYFQLLEAKEIVINNLEILKETLNQCVIDGLIDSYAKFYNEILGLIADAKIASSWDELSEAITLAQALENDISAWLARKGRTSISMQWPQQPTT